MSYDALRHFADSWGLLLMTVVFGTAVLWTLRPGARGRYRDQAEIPFKHSDKEDPNG
jgi:cytochrome c oxidase cbb3-type subunit 4